MAKDKKKSKQVKEIPKSIPYKQLTDADNIEKTDKTAPQSFEERLNKALREVDQTKPLTESEIERLERFNGPL